MANQTEEKRSLRQQWPWLVLGLVQVLSAVAQYRDYRELIQLPDPANEWGPMAQEKLLFFGVYVLLALIFFGSFAVRMWVQSPRTERVASAALLLTSAAGIAGLLVLFWQKLPMGKLVFPALLGVVSLVGGIAILLDLVRSKQKH